MHLSRIVTGVALAAAVAVALPASIAAHLSAPMNVPGINKPVIIVTGEVTGPETWANTNYYVLRGAVFVRSGATLTIEAGTTVIGESGSVGTLIVERGGRLMAVGTPTAPIVFTSDQAPGTRSRGDWGGLIINGRAPLNLEGGEGAGEGDTGVYGGSDPDDNSGILKYVRVEFSGIEFSPDNELNGIALQGVGRGTVLDFVQAHMSRDDAIEFFGGTVDLKHAVMSNAADDSLDWTFGWIGRAQFIAIHQRGDDADNAIEADNNEFNNNLLPRSNPQIYNITICGAHPTGLASEVQRAGNIRRGTAFTIRNFLVTGMRQGFQIADANTAAQVNNGTSQMGAGVSWNNLSNMHSSVTAFINSGRFPSIVLGTDPGLSTAGCANSAAPNFQPTAGGLAGGGMIPFNPPMDGFFDPVSFVGAVPPPPAANWMAGWTAFPQN